jgi:hypothetical protein
VRAALLLGLCACGFAPETSFSGRRIGDGVSPWKDHGAIELCLGNQRIGPAGSAVGGMCVAEGTTEADCALDTDCRSREACVCGRCTLKYCSVASECGDTGSCVFSESRCLPTCRQDSDCRGANELCAGGVCKGRCGTSAECQTGEYCTGAGRCNVSTCSDPTQCRSGDTCHQQRLPRATAEPSPLADEAGIILYLEMADAADTTRDVWRAVSTDGISFQLDPSPVLAAARAPSIVRLGTKYRMFVETEAGIASADSSDGRVFGSPGVVIPGDYHAPGAAVTPDGQVIVYVAEGDRGGLAVWEGSGTPRPVLTMSDITDPVYWRGVDHLGSPSALVETSPLGQPAIHVWFDAFGQESNDSIQFGMPVTIPPNDSVGFASTLLAAPDRLIRYPYNPVFDRTEALLDHRGERAPAVVRLPDGETYFLYYQGSSADGTQAEGIGLARNPSE